MSQLHIDPSSLPTKQAQTTSSNEAQASHSEHEVGKAGGNPGLRQHLASDENIPNRRINNNFDFLRACAVSCVLGNHILNTFYDFSHRPTWFGVIGRLGVLFFFVHTAFVLMESLERHGRKRSWIADFYIRRAFRIYPLSILLLGLVLALRIPQSPQDTFFSHPWWEITANFFLVQNFIPIRSILAPMWSLPYEVQMYLLLPGVFMLLKQSNSHKNLKRTAGLVLAALALARLNYAWPNLGLAEFFPCFMGGVLSWQLRKIVTPRLPSWTFPGALLLLSSSFVLAATRVNDIKYQWAVCLCLGAILPCFRQFENRWITRASQTIAKYSYGIYLVHNPVLWLVFMCMGVSLLIKWPLFLLLMVVVPVVTYHLIEKPFIDLGDRIVRSRSTEGMVLTLPTLNALRWLLPARSMRQ